MKHLYLLPLIPLRTYYLYTYFKSSCMAYNLLMLQSNKNLIIFFLNGKQHSENRILIVKCINYFTTTEQ